MSLAPPSFYLGRKSRASSSASPLYTVIVKRDYSANTSEELSLTEGHLLNVLEDRETQLFCFSTNSKEYGVVNKVLVEKQGQYPTLGGLILFDQFDTELMSCRKDDKVIAVARCIGGYVYCKLLKNKDLQGKVKLENIFIDGDIHSLPSIDKYQKRSQQSTRVNSSTNSPQLGRKSQFKRTTSTNSLTKAIQELERLSGSSK